MLLPERMLSRSASDVWRKLPCTALCTSMKISRPCKPTLFMLLCFLRMSPQGCDMSIIRDHFMTRNSISVRVSKWHNAVRHQLAMLEMQDKIPAVRQSRVQGWVQSTERLREKLAPTLPSSLSIEKGHVIAAWEWNLLGSRPRLGCLAALPQGQWLSAHCPRDQSRIFAFGPHRDDGMSATNSWPVCCKCNFPVRGLQPRALVHAA